MRCGDVCHVAHELERAETVHQRLCIRDCACIRERARGDACGVAHRASRLGVGACGAATFVTSRMNLRGQRLLSWRPDWY